MVTGGLSDAAAQQGPLGLCMQLCGRWTSTGLSKGFWTNSTCGQLDGSALASLSQHTQMTPHVEILNTVYCPKLREKGFSLSPQSLFYCFKASESNKKKCLLILRCHFFIPAPFERYHKYNSDPAIIIEVY